MLKDIPQDGPVQRGWITHLFSTGSHYADSARSRTQRTPQPRSYQQLKRVQISHGVDLIKLALPEYDGDKSKIIKSPKVTII
jgi:hypothetical protein